MVIFSLALILIILFRSEGIMGMRKSLEQDVRPFARGV